MPCSANSPGARINTKTIVRQWAMTRWQSLEKLTISAILLAILYHRPGNWAFEPTGRAHCSCSFREMSFHELTVELSAFDASLRMRGAIAPGWSANRRLSRNGVLGNQRNRPASLGRVTGLPETDPLRRGR